MATIVFVASLHQRLPENVPGDFFVDSTCIDCETCSQLAPAIFRDHGDQCSVYRQPETDAETQLAMMALVSCPTGSIGATERHDAHLGIDAFPMLLEDNVYFCGFTSESSFGAWSYLITRPASVLIEFDVVWVSARRAIVMACAWWPIIPETKWTSASVNG